MRLRLRQRPSMQCGALHAGMASDVYRWGANSTVNPWSGGRRSTHHLWRRRKLYGGVGSIACNRCVLRSRRRRMDHSAKPEFRSIAADGRSSGTTIYTFGGLADCINGSVPLGSLESWSPGATSWSLVSGANPPSARYAHNSGWTGSGVLVYGGADGSLHMLRWAPSMIRGPTHGPTLLVRLRTASAIMAP